MQKTRPTGVTIIAILEALGGIIMLLFGLGMVALGTFVAIPGGMMPGVLGMMAGFLGFVFIIIGVLSLIFAWGLWTGQSWAWTLTLVFAILGVIFGLLSLPGSIIQIIIQVIIIYYLFRPNVKAFFGKGA